MTVPLAVWGTHVELYETWRPSVTLNVTNGLPLPLWTLLPEQVLMDGRIYKKFVRFNLTEIIKSDSKTADKW